MKAYPLKQFFPPKLNFTLLDHGHDTRELRREDLLHWPLRLSCSDYMDRVRSCDPGYACDRATLPSQLNGRVLYVSRLRVDNA